MTHLGCWRVVATWALLAAAGCPERPASDAGGEGGGSDATVRDAPRDEGMDATARDDDGGDDAASLDGGLDGGVRDACALADRVLVRRDGEPEWWCLNSGCSGAGDGSTWRLTFQVDRSSLGGGEGGVYPGVTVKACARDDLDCAAPVGDGGRTTDDGGAVTFELTEDGARGWDGYFEITGEGPGAPYPTRYFPVAPLTHLTRATSETVVPRAVVEGLAMMNDITLDPAAGHLVGSTFDCERSSASGVSYALDGPALPPGAIAFYLTGDPPMPVSVPMATSTDANGVGGFLNLPAGRAPVTLRATTGGRRIGEVSVTIRAGYMTTFGMRPLPPP